MQSKSWQNPPTWPSPVLFTIDDFNRMINAGIFDHRPRRIELIQGELKEMSPASEEHDDVLLRLTTWAGANVAGRFHVASQIGVQLLQSSSMPEPDLVLVNLSHGRGRVTSECASLVVEVGVTSLEYDLTVKQSLYAAENIPEYWVIDPIAQTVTVHLKPLGQRYASIEIFTVGQAISTPSLPDARLDLHWLFIE